MKFLLQAKNAHEQRHISNYVVDTDMMRAEEDPNMSTMGIRTQLADMRNFVEEHFSEHFDIANVMATSFELIYKPAAFKESHPEHHI